MMETMKVEKMMPRGTALSWPWGRVDQSCNPKKIVQHCACQVSPLTAESVGVHM